MRTAYIVDILRTPVGKFGGTLSTVRPDDMAALVMKEIAARNPGLDPALIEDVVMGAANQAGEDNRNVARMALLLAGLPQEIGGVTVNRLCASGLQAMIDASRAIASGDGDVYLAGGVENMTRAPFVMAKAETAFSRTPEIYDTTIGWRFTNPALSKLHYPFAMGETAENVAERYGISRETQDEFAHSSQVKYKAAAEAGKFNDEIVPVHIAQRKGEEIVFDTDEHPRLSSVEKLATLAPAFKKGGSVTAGNSSGINDGAAVSIIVSEEVLKRYDLKPMARVVSVAVAGVDPAHMGIGPVPATQKALKRAGLSIKDIDLVELNEAFAAQAIACLNELGLDPAKVNVNGGSIAIGHPLGASGTRISATLLHEMKRRDNARYGLATMCVGVGQGVAVIYEKV
ncbi:thiolase family protein [Pontibacter chinhatensis]|uniref:acetyl-CoA C-acyltransferase n=1 Tax=Pontibacter chinhatensis TaxID=1436961 RepID=A0A1I2TIQ2_9BACT|nr:acetyl-CoA C-acyltransferase [Pontibacter chinhatensis]SFG64758.1 acetyl-CoA C-acetyltransferase [Pontibacter chinhatensis]